MAMLAIILLKVVVFIHSFFSVFVIKNKLRPPHFYSHFREGNEKVAMLCGV